MNVFPSAGAAAGSAVAQLLSLPDLQKSWDGAGRRGAALRSGDGVKGRPPLRTGLEPLFQDITRRTLLSTPVERGGFGLPWKRLPSCDSVGLVTLLHVTGRPEAITAGSHLRQTLSAAVSTLLCSGVSGRQRCSGHAGRPAGLGHLAKRRLTSAPFTETRTAKRKRKNDSDGVGDATGGTELYWSINFPICPTGCGLFKSKNHILFNSIFLISEQPLAHRRHSKNEERPKTCSIPISEGGNEADT